MNPFFFIILSGLYFLFNFTFHSLYSSLNFKLILTLKSAAQFGEKTVIKDFIELGSIL
ncbi:hypothetical protein Scep_002301 [Stephania cephalantha]|uniref:Uncharacterized protein n=1 Tax=Stephania cephalantha TaxID=152367 RepID=A0AAP0Q4I5_9MAGN